MALALAFAALFILMSSWTVSNPVRPDPQRGVAMGLGIVAIVLAMLSSRVLEERRERVAASAAIILAILAEWVALQNYLQNHGDYTWPILWVAFGGVAIGGWFCHQRAVAACCTVFLSVWFYGLLTPSMSHMPATAYAKGIRATLMPPTDSKSVFWTLTLSSEYGESLSRIIKLDSITASPQLGPLIRFQPAHAFTNAPFDISVPALATEEFSIKSQTPGWVRSCDIHVKAFLWPREFVASVAMPVESVKEGKDTGVYSNRSGRYAISVTSLRMAPSRTRFPVEPCIAFTATYSGFSYSGMKGTELRVTDQFGRSVEWASSNVSGSHDGATIEGEVFPIPERITELRFDLFSEAQTKDSWAVFEFHGMPRTCAAIKRGA